MSSDSRWIIKIKVATKMVTKVNAKGLGDISGSKNSAGFRAYTCGSHGHAAAAGRAEGQ